MPKERPPRLIMNITLELRDRINEFRFANKIKTEADAVRELLERSLTAEEKKGKS